MSLSPFLSCCPSRKDKIQSKFILKPVSRYLFDRIHSHLGQDESFARIFLASSIPARMQQRAPETFQFKFWNIVHWLTVQMTAFCCNGLTFDIYPARIAFQHLWRQRWRSLTSTKRVGAFTIIHPIKRYDCISIHHITFLQHLWVDHVLEKTSWYPNDINS